MNNTKKIQTYDDLLEEKKRLEILLASKKGDIKQDWQGVKQSLTPVTNVVGFLGKVTHRKRISPALDMGIDLVGDMLFRKVLLSKADWVTKLLLPLFIKNYSSNVLGGVSGSTFFGKIRTILKERKAKRKMDEAMSKSENFDQGPIEQDPGVHAQPNAGMYGNSAGDIASR